MPVTSGGFRAQMGALRAAYVAQLPDKVRRVQAAWEQVCRSSAAEDLATLQRLAHNLAGSGATFGFSSLSGAARDLCDLLARNQESGRALAPEQQTFVDAVVARLVEIASSAQRRLASDSLDGPPCGISGLPMPPESFRQEITMDPSMTINTVPRRALGKPAHWARHVASGNRLVLLVEDDAEVAEDLASQLGQFGYEVRLLSDLAGLQEAVESTPPGVILMDIVFPDGALAGAEAIRRVQEGRATPLPVVFISARTDLAARLAAVRAGGIAYFPKPVDVAGLVDKLDHGMSERASEPYRVLVVEDDQHLASYYALVLRQSGILAEVVTDPLHVMQPLVEFRPDLILMDVYMPGCTGTEVAAVIRQQDAYITVPILFLSVENEPGRQLEAISLGGDDFLSKPISPHHLVLAVSSRIQRARSLRSLMVRDGLTGLLNHTHIKEQLSVEMSRAIRKQTGLAYAMIDLDHFKRVNDTYGHPVGDRVLKSLSRLLEQRLRRTDIIGRYGGEEFAVILLDMDGPTAVSVMEEIRRGFQRIHHQADGEEFSVTLSCGIATFPEYGDISAIGEAADRALYDAKHAGRNQVVLADYVGDREPPLSTKPR